MLLRLLFVVVSALLCVFGLTPVVVMLATAARDFGAPFVHELSDPATRQAWLNSVLLSAAVTLIAVPVGASLAWLLERTDLGVRSSPFASTAGESSEWLVAALTLPLAIPPYLLAMAWALLGNGRNGLINRWLGHAWIDLYGLDGTIIVLATTAYPFAFVAVRAALMRADPSLEEAARLAGASTFRVVRDVTWPLMMPAAAAAAGLVFVFSMASFGVPYLMGSGAEPPVYVMTTRIFRFTALGGEGMLARAAALAGLLLVTALIAQLLLARLGQRHTVVQVRGKVARPQRIALGHWRRPLRFAVAAFIGIIVVVPVVVIAATSFQSTFAPDARWTPMHWQNVWSRDETLRAFGHSVILAVAAAGIVSVFGLLFARMAGPPGPRRTSFIGRAFSSLATLPHAVPGTVLAIGLILTFTKEFRLIIFERITFVLFLPGTLALLCIAYAAKYLAFGVRGARAAMDQVDASLEESARLSGASTTGALRDIVWPLISPAVRASFVVVALPCLSELTMSVLLFGAQTETAGTLLFELQSYADPPAASVVAVVLMLIALMLHALIHGAVGRLFAPSEDR